MILRRGGPGHGAATACSSSVVWTSEDRGCTPISKPTHSATSWPSGRIDGCPPPPGGPRRDALAASVPRGAWQRLSAGRGAKGQRYYDRAWITLTRPHGHHWLLIRRHSRRGDLAFYRCYAPHPVRLGELVRVAGRRWSVEESFQTAKGLTGLDEHQMRRWPPCRRWTLLAMLPPTPGLHGRAGRRCRRFLHPGSRRRGIAAPHARAISDVGRSACSIAPASSRATMALCESVHRRSKMRRADDHMRVGLHTVTLMRSVRSISSHCSRLLHVACRLFLFPLLRDR
jgi:hypothetical protein